MPDLRLAAHQFELLRRNLYPKKWRDVSTVDKSELTELNRRLSTFIESAAKECSRNVPLKPFFANTQLAGSLTKKGLECGLVPEVVPKKNVSMMVSMNVSWSGLRFAFKVGDGHLLRVRDERWNVEFCRNFLSRCQSKLKELSSELRMKVSANDMEHIGFFRNYPDYNTESLFSASGDISNLNEWVGYASQPEGKDAAIILCYSPAEAAGMNAAEEFSNFVNQFVPVLDRIYQPELTAGLRIEAFKTGTPSQQETKDRFQTGLELSDEEGATEPSSNDDELDYVMAVLSGRRIAGPAFQRDIDIKLAVEKHAMNLAKKHYSRDWMFVHDVSAQESYDLLCKQSQSDRSDELRVEVKGTQGIGKQIILTRNEVINAKSTRTALFIIANIKVLDSEGTLITVGGDIVEIDPWNPADTDLEPIQYRYQVGD